MRTQTKARTDHHCCTVQAFKAVLSEGLLSGLTPDRETELTHGFLATGISEIALGVKRFLEVGGEEIHINSPILVDIRHAYWDLKPGEKLKINFPTDVLLKREQASNCPWIDVTCVCENKFFVSFGDGFSEANLRGSLEGLPVFNLKKLDFQLGFIPGHPGVKAFSESLAVKVLKDALRQYSIPTDVDQGGDLQLNLEGSLFRVNLAIKFWSTDNVITQRTNDGLFLIAPDLSAYNHPPEILTVKISHEPTYGNNEMLFDNEALSRDSKLINSFLIERFDALPQSLKMPNTSQGQV